MFYPSIYLQWTGSFILAIFCLFNFRSRPGYIRTLGAYAAASVLFQLAQQVSMSFFGNAGLNELGSVFTLIEAILLSVVFHLVIQHAVFKKFVSASVIIYVVYYLITIIFFVDLSFSLVRFGRDVLMILLALLYFYYLIQKLPEDNLITFPMFWINAAVIFYFSGTFVLSLTSDYIVQVLGDDRMMFWTFRNLLRVFYCLMLTYAAWLEYRTKNSGIRTTP